MIAPPADARDLGKCVDYGVDQNGLYVFFGFERANADPVHIQANHLALGNLVNYLQTIATEAQRRRLQVDPSAEHKEVRGSEPNPIRQLDCEVSVTGDSTALLCTTQAGTRMELQLPLDLLEGLHRHLPALMEEMKRRMAQHKTQQH